jgi:Flp pilus assembly pilin Flp
MTGLSTRTLEILATMVRRLRALSLTESDGQTLVEYGLILSFVVIGTILVLTAIGNELGRQRHLARWSSCAAGLC